MRLAPSEPMFTPEFRERVREYVLRLARSDQRIIAGAAIGSDATGGSDRWSDLDLTFGLQEGILPIEVLNEWTSDLERNFAAIPLFDLPSGTTLYRVFLMPGNLQVDLSLTPGFVADYGPRFKLLFGTKVNREHSSSRPAREAIGYAAHHAVRARYSIERGRLWQAEYWISGVRDEALALACIRRGLDASHGRGWDRLPSDLLDSARDALVRSLDRMELMRALGCAIALLLREANETSEFPSQLEPCLRSLIVADEH